MKVPKASAASTTVQDPTLIVAMLEDENKILNDTEGMCVNALRTTPGYVEHARLIHDLAFQCLLKLQALAQRPGISKEFVHEVAVLMKGMIITTTWGMIEDDRETEAKQSETRYKLENLSLDPLPAPSVKKPLFIKKRDRECTECSSSQSALASLDPAIEALRASKEAFCESQGACTDVSYMGSPRVSGEDRPSASGLGTKILDFVSEAIIPSAYAEEVPPPKHEVSFKELWSEYKYVEREDRPSWVFNTCAFNMSNALAKAGAPTPIGYVTTSHDGKSVLFRLKDLDKYLEENKIGTVMTPTRFEEIQGKRGILYFKVDDFGDATGHSTLWDGARFHVEDTYCTPPCGDTFVSDPAHFCPKPCGEVLFERATFVRFYEFPNEASEGLHDDQILKDTNGK